MNVVGDFFGGRQHLTEKLHLARAQGAATAGVALPAKIETNQLPHGVKAQASRHHRITFKVAGKKPQVRVDIQFGDQFTLAELATFVADVCDAIDHQHVGGGQLRITWAEQLATTAAQQVFTGKGVLFGHASSSIISCGRLWRHWLERWSCRTNSPGPCPAAYS